MNKRRYILLPTLVLLLSLYGSCSEAKKETEQREEKTYQNPVVARSLPDPTILQTGDGEFYLYATVYIFKLMFTTRP